MKKIAIISDTHSFLDEKVKQMIDNCDEIWHAGDFGYSNDIKKFIENHTVKGVYGNVDGDEIRSLYPKIQKFICEGIKVLMVHIGGGDPVYGNSDDPIRFAVSKLAHIHCCTSKQYCDNLINIGEEKFRIFLTGNPSYDNIDKVKEIYHSELSKAIGKNLKKGNYLVLIHHPLSSEVKNSHSQMIMILKATKDFCLKHNFTTICISPNSDPGSFKILNAIDSFKDESWFLNVNTLPRDIFVNLMRGTKVLVGNSSMGILEAPHYKLPVVNVGNRQKGRVNAGNVNFVNYNKEEIISAIERACFDESYRENVKNLLNPYGINNSVENICKAIESIDLNDKKWYNKERLC